MDYVPEDRGSYIYFTTFAETFNMKTMSAADLKLFISNGSLGWGIFVVAWPEVDMMTFFLFLHSFSDVV